MGQVIIIDHKVTGNKDGGISSENQSQHHGKSKIMDNCSAKEIQSQSRNRVVPAVIGVLLRVLFMALLKTVS